MKYKEVVNEDNEGRIYSCEVEVGGQSLGVWEIMVRKDWYKDGYVLTRNFYDDVFLHIKPSWIKNVIKDATPPQQMSLF